MPHQHYHGFYESNSSSDPKLTTHIISLKLMESDFTNESSYLHKTTSKPITNYLIKFHGSSPWQYYLIKAHGLNPWAFSTHDHDPST